MYSLVSILLPFLSQQYTCTMYKYLLDLDSVFFVLIIFISEKIDLFSFNVITFVVLYIYFPLTDKYAKLISRYIKYQFYG